MVSVPLGVLSAGGGGVIAVEMLVGVGVVTA